MDTFIKRHFDGYILVNKNRSSLGITILPGVGDRFYARVSGQVQAEALTASEAIRSIAIKWGINVQSPGRRKWAIDIEDI